MVQVDPPLSPRSPFHPQNRLSVMMLFSFSFLCSLRFIDIVAMREDYLKYTSKSERRELMGRIVKAYHDFGSGNKNDGEKALYELLLRLIYELLSGHISLNDIRYRTWHKSGHREPKHGIRIEKLLRRIYGSSKAITLKREIRWL